MVVVFACAVGAEQAIHRAPRPTCQIDAPSDYRAGVAEVFLQRDGFDGKRTMAGESEVRGLEKPGILFTGSKTLPRRQRV